MTLSSRWIKTLPFQQILPNLLLTFNDILTHRIQNYYDVCVLDSEEERYRLTNLWATAMITHKHTVENVPNKIIEFCVFPASSWLVDVQHLSPRRCGSDSRC